MADLRKNLKILVFLLKFCEFAVSQVTLPLRSYPCILWSKYNYDLEPEINGVLMGTNIDSKPVYIGRGFQGRHFIPGRLQVTDPKGLYISGYAERRIADYVEYLVLAQGCVCHFLPATIDDSSEALVIVPNEPHKFAIGRKTFSNGQVSVAKVTFPTLVQYFSDEQGVETSDQAAEMLFCESAKDDNYTTLTTVGGITRINFHAEETGFRFK